MVNQKDTTATPVFKEGQSTAPTPVQPIQNMAAFNDPVLTNSINAILGKIPLQSPTTTTVNPPTQSLTSALPTSTQTLSNQNPTQTTLSSITCD